MTKLTPLFSCTDVKGLLTQTDVMKCNITLPHNEANFSPNEASDAVQCFIKSRKNLFAHGRADVFGHSLWSKTPIHTRRTVFTHHH